MKLLLNINTPYLVIKSCCQQKNRLPFGRVLYSFPVSRTFAVCLENDQQISFFGTEHGACPSGDSEADIAAHWKATNVKFQSNFNTTSLLRTEKVLLLMVRRHICAQLMDSMHLDFIATPQGGHQEVLNHSQNIAKLLRDSQIGSVHVPLMKSKHIKDK